MNTEPAIPCPVCQHPVMVRYISLQSGEVARVYTEPLITADEVVIIHAHQQDDVNRKALH